VPSSAPWSRSRWCWGPPGLLPPRPASRSKDAPNRDASPSAPPMSGPASHLVFLLCIFRHLLSVALYGPGWSPCISALDAGLALIILHHASHLLKTVLHGCIYVPPAVAPLPHASHASCHIAPQPAPQACLSEHAASQVASQALQLGSNHLGNTRGLDCIKCKTKPPWFSLRRKNLLPT
jgi:hypothetical protein